MKCQFCFFDETTLNLFLLKNNMSVSLCPRQFSVSYSPILPYHHLFCRNNVDSWCGEERDQPKHEKNKQVKSVQKTISIAYAVGVENFHNVMWFLRFLVQFLIWFSDGDISLETVKKWWNEFMIVFQKYLVAY
jgi:hypothetical protein